MYTKKIVAALAAVAPVFAKKAGRGYDVCESEAKLNLYWGQDPTQIRLAEYCKETKPDIISLAFMNVSPENGGDAGWPGTNFAAHCSAKVFSNGNAESKLLDCAEVAEDAQTCQEAGVKILLSIGGEYSERNDYSIKDVEEGKKWAEFLWNAFGPKLPTYDGPRPFDTEYKEFCIDGFDFDLEYKFDNQEPWIKMIEKLRELASESMKELYLTAAPQCPLSPDYFQMSEILANVAFDALFIQFYNNEYCDAIPSSTPGDEFGYAAWEAYVSQEGCVNQNTKLFIGLPAVESSGYLDRDAVKEVLCDVIENPDYTHFGGVSLWDAQRASSNLDDYDVSYSEHIQSILRCGCRAETSEPTSSTSTYEPSETSSSYEPSETSSSYEPSETSSSYEPSETSGYDLTSTTSYPTSASSHYPEPTGDYDDECDEDDEDDEDYEDECDDEEEPTSSWSSGPTYPTTTPPPHHYTTRTVWTTTTYTITSCPPHKGPCHHGQVTTKVIPAYTTVCPVTDEPEPTKNPSHPHNDDYDYKCPGGKYCQGGYEEEDSKNNAEQPASECPYGDSCGKKDEGWTPKPTTLHTTRNGAAKPTGTGCYGEGCPAGPSSTSKMPVTAGAGSVAFSLVAVIAAAVLAL